DEVKHVAHKHRRLGSKLEHYPRVRQYLLLALNAAIVDDATNDITNAWDYACGVTAQLFIDIEKEMYDATAEQPGGWDGYQDCVVVNKVKESDVITSFYLKPYDNNVLAEYETSQYLTIRVKIPNEEYTQIRHYTISAAPGSDTYRISVKKETDFTPNG